MTGNICMTGISGTTSEFGSIGNTGLNGPIGSMNISFGPTGMTGLSNMQGYVGNTGAMGNNGMTGTMGTISNVMIGASDINDLEEKKQLINLLLNNFRYCFIIIITLNVLSKTTYVYLNEVYGREANIARRRNNTLRHSGSE